MSISIAESQTLYRSSVTARLDRDGEEPALSSADQRVMMRCWQDAIRTDDCATLVSLGRIMPTLVAGIGRELRK